jgi:hypothetical protein
MKPLLSLKNLKRSSLKETGLSKDRFISIDIGPIVGHIIILKSNMKSLPPTSRGNRGSEGILVSDFGTEVVWCGV